MQTPSVLACRQKSELSTSGMRAMIFAMSAAARLRLVLCGEGVRFD